MAIGLNTSRLAMRGEWDIRASCPNRVKYLREAVDMLRHNYHDVDVVDSGTELGPCVYRTVFRVAVSNPEDVALAVARINEFIRSVKAQLEGYWWLFEKASHVDGGYVYMDAIWLRRIWLPFKKYATPMDIYELAAPHLGSGSK